MGARYMAAADHMSAFCMRMHISRVSSLEKGRSGEPVIISGSRNPKKKNNGISSDQFTSLLFIRLSPIIKNNRATRSTQTML